MSWNGWAISIATFLPLVGAIAIALVPGSRDRLARGLGIAVTGAAMVVAIAIAVGFDYGNASALQFTVDRRKIQLEDPIKQLGEFKIPVRLHREVTTEITVVVAKDKVLHLECTGLADVAAGRAMTPDTLFNIMSMTKPVT